MPPDELFHYTTYDFAEEVLADVDGAYAEVSRGTYGMGFYALDLGPDQATRDQLRYECFGDSRPEHTMDGVLVLDAYLAVPPFEQVGGHIWLQAQDPGREPIGYMVPSIGLWDGTGWVMYDI